MWTKTVVVGQMSDQIQNTSLPEHFRTIKRNFDSLIEQFPDFYLAAEQINDLFDQLFTERITIRNNELWEYASVRMLFGSYSSWTFSLLMTASGLNDIGLMALRRSIEFACYISKIKNSNKRAELWMSKSDNLDNRKQFNGVFSIPNAYFSYKYKHLSPLLIWYDYASDYGVHANYATLVEKWKNDNEVNDFKMSFHDSPERIPLSSFVTVQIGSFIIEVLIYDLNENLKDIDEFQKRIDVMKDIMRHARIEIAENEYDGHIPYEILKSINSEDSTAIDKYFKDLKSRYES